MADIFISYDRSNYYQAFDLAQKFKKQGFDVWWDRFIRVGAQWDKLIDEELQAAGCVVVLWSSESRGQQSSYVTYEANTARKDGRLIQVILDGHQPPADFRDIQYADLSNWSGDPLHPAYSDLTAGICSILKKDPRELNSLTNDLNNLTSRTLSFWLAALSWLVFFIIPAVMLGWVHWGDRLSYTENTDLINSGNLFDIIFNAKASGLTIWDQLRTIFFTHENLYLYAATLMPLSVYFLVRSGPRIWLEQLSPWGRIFTLLVGLTGSCVFAYVDHVYDSRVAVAIMKPREMAKPLTKEDSRVQCKVNMWEHLATRSNIACRDAARRLLTRSEKRDDRIKQEIDQIHPSLAFAHLIGLFGLYSFWIFYVATLGIATFGQRPLSISAAVPKILLCGVLSFSWFVFYVPYLIGKKEIFGADPLEAGIYIACLIVGLFYYSWTVLTERFLRSSLDRHLISLIFWICAFITVISIAQEATLFAQARLIQQNMPWTILIGIPAYTLLYLIALMPFGVARIDKPTQSGS